MSVRGVHTRGVGGIDSGLFLAIVGSVVESRGSGNGD